MSGLKVDTRFLDLSAYYTALQTDALLAGITGGSSLTNYYTKTQTDALLVTKQANLSGTGIVKSTGGTISYLTDNSTNWDSAYGWGNHASAGYLTTISGIAAGGELSGTYPNPTVLNSAVIGKTLTGYISGAGIVSAADTILQAIQKLNGNTVALTSSGTTNYIPKFSSGSLVNSQIFDNGSFVGIRTTTGSTEGEAIRLTGKTLIDADTVAIKTTATINLTRGIYFTPAEHNVLNSIGAWGSSAGLSLEHSSTATGTVVAKIELIGGNLVFYSQSGSATTERMRIAALTGVVSISSATASTSTTTGALIVSGGLGVGGNINAADITGVNISATNRFISANYVSSDYGSAHKINLSSNITAFTNNNVEIARITSSGFYIGTTATTDNLYSVKSIIIPDFSTANNAGVFITNNRAFSAGGAFLAIYNYRVTDTQGTGTIPKSAIRSAVEFAVSSNIGNTQSESNAHNFTVKQVANDLNYLNSQFTYNITGYTNSGTQQINVQSYFYLQGTANATTAYGFRSRGQFATTGSSITTLYDFVTDDFVNAPSGGTISNRYGLYLNNTNTGVTNSWGVYQTSANTNNYFAGKVSINNTNTSFNLDVTGTQMFRSTASNAPITTYNNADTTGFLNIIGTNSSNGRMAWANIGSIDFGSSFLFRNYAGSTSYMSIDSTSVSIVNTTASTSTTTGALKVAGGVGMAGALYTGAGIVNATGHVYLPNSTSIYFRNAANSAYLRALTFASDNNFKIGEDSNITYLLSNYIGLGTASIWSKITIGGGNVTLLNNIEIQGVDSTNVTYYGMIKVATDNRIYISSSGRDIRMEGKAGFGVNPTAILHLKAGTATANTAPLKFTTSGAALLTTPEAGVMEVDSSGVLYYTPISTRKQIAFTSDITGTNSGTNTGDQTITLTGAVTGSGTGSFATTLASAIVEISNLSATGTPDSTTFLRGDNTWAVPSGGGGLSDGDKGDITVSSSGATWTIDNGVVTLAKMANMATTSLIGRNTAGTGVPEVLSASTAKTLLSLNNVENTALSTWAGTTNITTLGTIATGTWSGSTIAVNKGGTGITSAGGFGSLLIGGGSSSFNTLAGNTTTTKKYLTQTGDGVDSDDPVWESLETAGISWITYSDTATWSVGTAPSGATNHEYRYWQIGKMVFGFIRLVYGTAGSGNTTLEMRTNSFPVISKPSNAANGEYLTSSVGFIDTAESGTLSASRCWLEASSQTSGFIVKIVQGSLNAKFAMCSFVYLTA